uniref:Neurogenic locus Notch protein n=1 Tax=Heligmosomoides polygyrus TaxID=6339 RepID=A0A183G3I3_HELPZ
LILLCEMSWRQCECVFCLYNELNLGFFCEVEVDECLTSPCRNGATCINRPGDFYCHCPRGFTGSLCEEQTEVCSARYTCFNGGTCIDSTKGYICSCPFGYVGERCQYQRHGLAPNTNSTNSMCVGCSSKAGNGRCDKECDSAECGYDGGECSRDPQLFKNCTSADYCAHVFRDGVCFVLQVCDNEACLFDGFDCRAGERRCSDHCRTKKRDGVCDEECNTRECEFDGGDCRKAPENIVRLTLPCHMVIAFVKAFFLVNRRTLQSMNMTIYSAVAEKPKHRPRLFSPLLFTMACVALMVAVALIFIVSQRGSRKRKIVENAPVWMPPTELETYVSFQVDEVDDENRTALMLVAMHDVTDTAIAEMLCDAGAEVDYDGRARTDHQRKVFLGRTALHFAAKYDNTKMVTYLLKRSANKDCQDYETLLLYTGGSTNWPDYSVLYSPAPCRCGGQCRTCDGVAQIRCESTQSTPTRCPATSPYNPMATPHSVAAFGSTYPSPQYPGHPMKLADGSAFGAVTSPRFQPSATEFSPAQYLPVNWSDTGAANGVVYSPHYHEEQVFFASVEKTVSRSSSINSKRISP